MMPQPHRRDHADQGVAGAQVGSNPRESWRVPNFHLVRRQRPASPATHLLHCSIDMPSRSNDRSPVKPRTSAAAATATEPVRPAKTRARARGRGDSTLTSMPTGRAAYLETRRWLVDLHGLTCAYCAKHVSERYLTLDHVAPRRGMTAYDRRDNLVLCCTVCNTQKADLTAMAWLLAKRMRAINLVRFGAHLSPQLVAITCDLAGPDGIALAAKLSDPDYPYAD